MLIEKEGTEAEVIETPETPTTEAPETPAVSADAPETTGEPAPTPELPAYTPDLKYTAAGEEREIDPRLAAAIKSKEDEEYVKKILAKADGIEQVQAHREHYRNEYHKIHGEVQNVLKAVDMGDYRGAFRSMGVENPDIGQVVKGMGFTKEQVIQYAYDLAQLTPEQEQAYAKQRELELQNKQLNMTAEQYQSRLQQLEVSHRERELQTALSTPDIAPIVKAFDEHHGKGAFWDEVLNRGLTHFYRRGVDAPVQDVVAEVARLYRGSATTQTATPAPGATPAQAASKSPDELPVIPSVGSGGGRAPAKAKIKSLDALKQYAQGLED